MDANVIRASVAEAISVVPGLGPCATALHSRCSLLGWATSGAHSQRCINAALATSYGKIAAKHMNITLCADRDVCAELVELPIYVTCCSIRVQPTRLMEQAHTFSGPPSTDLARAIEPAIVNKNNVTSAMDSKYRIDSTNAELWDLRDEGTLRSTELYVLNHMWVRWLSDKLQPPPTLTSASSAVICISGRLQPIL